MDNVELKIYIEGENKKYDQSFIDKIVNQLQNKYNKYLEPIGVGKIICYLLINYSREISGGITITRNGYITVIKLSNFSKYEQDVKFKSFYSVLSGIFLEDLEDFLKKNNYNNLFLIISADKNIDFLESLIKEKNIENGKSEVDSVFIPMTPKYSIDKIVLNKATKEEIFKTITILKQAHILYEDWGFKEIEPLPKAILNFYGPPGTGKTMTAHAIANILGKKILALNYADIESKFVGDAPKNLVKAFKTANEEDAVLFFDEADSFLGKRITSVATSADQAVNSLRSQLLMLIEDFSGVVIFATNLIENYDQAFKSRIFKHIKFDLPDSDLRKEMIISMIPKKVPLRNPLDESEISKLVELSDGFSGRDIKNCIRDALISAIHDSKSFVDFEYFVNSFENYRKSKLSIDKNLSEDDLRQIKEKVKQSLNNQNLEENFDSESS